MNRNFKFILLTTLILALMFLDGFGQQNPQKKFNSFYAEYASDGPDYSVNFDHVFSRGDLFSKSYRIGFSFLNNTIALPLGLQFFTGKKASHFEMSLSLIPYVEKYQELFSGNNISDKKMMIMPGAGYRYQKSTAGFFGKIVAGPMINLDPPSDDFWNMTTTVRMGITIAAGYSF